MSQTVQNGENATFNCSSERGQGTIYRWLYSGTCLNCSSLPTNANIDGELITQRILFTAQLYRLCIILAKIDQVSGCVHMHM